MKTHFFLLLFIYLISAGSTANAQMITGYWKGKIDRKNVELKIVKNGDSITGTSYYYESPDQFRRYSIKGYFSSSDNSVVWWDDILIEEKGKKTSPSEKKLSYFSKADFNCPGGSKMYLDGKASPKNKEGAEDRTVALEKNDTHIFIDEWDYVIDNYTLGANDPELIDSIGKLAYIKARPQAPKIPVSPLPITKTAPVRTAAQKNTPVAVTQKETPLITPDVKPVVIAPLTNEQKFTRRNKKLIQEINISGDSIELNFYDNAEVDGDSIAIFLNSKLLYQHIRLTDKPYIIKLAVAELQQTNELVMVAENLGSIPPNTSLMVTIIEGKRYEARLESTENSSALIRFMKK